MFIYLIHFAVNTKSSKKNLEKFWKNMQKFISIHDAAKVIM